MSKSTTTNKCPYLSAECQPVGADTKWFKKTAVSIKKPKRVQTLYRKRESDILVVAPHGGRIEPHTEEIAGIIAEKLGAGCYCFCSGDKREDRSSACGCDGQHIASEHIAAECLSELVHQSKLVIAVHGCGPGKDSLVHIGGGNISLADAIGKLLKSDGLSVTRKCRASLGGTHPRNFANRGKGLGVQFEIQPQPFRADGGYEESRRLAEAIATAVEEAQWTDKKWPRLSEESKTRVLQLLAEDQQLHPHQYKPPHAKPHW